MIIDYLNMIFPIFTIILCMQGICFNLISFWRKEITGRLLFTVIIYPVLIAIAITLLLK